MGISSEESVFYRPTATHNPLRFHLPITEQVCVGPPERRFLMGGVGLATAIEALEIATERPLIWATAQYLSFVQPGSVMDLDVRAPVVGRTASQARVVAHVGEREILTVNAALGARAEQPVAQFAPAPEVPAPHDCPVRQRRFGSVPNDLNDQFEQRSVPRSSLDPPGSHRTWIRCRQEIAPTPGLLAIAADFLLGAVGPVLARPVSTSSLDNTLRIHAASRQATEPAGWILCDTRLHGVGNGFCYGEMHLFDRKGVLLASGSQSGIVRPRPTDAEEASSEAQAP